MTAVVDTFDAVGNRLSLRDRRGLQAYEYDEADELLEVESDFNPEEPSMKGSLFARLGASDANKPLFRTVYGWDADGNQVRKTGPGNKASLYEFDALDRLAEVSAPGSEPVKYLYNADRQRVATMRGKDSVVERFLRLGRGRQVLGDLDGQGELAKRYILLPSGQLLAHVDYAGTKPAFYHFDALGSTVVMSDSTNRIITRFVYDPYGARRSVPETEEGRGFVGAAGVCRENPDLLRMGVRYYAIDTGRFISIDPLYATRARIGHSYTYSANNPTTLIDPTGYITVSIGGIQSGGAGLGGSKYTALTIGFSLAEGFSACVTVTDSVGSTSPGLFGGVQVEFTTASSVEALADDSIELAVMAGEGAQGGVCIGAGVDPKSPIGGASYGSCGAAIGLGYGYPVSVSAMKQTTKLYPF